MSGTIPVSNDSRDTAIPSALSPTPPSEFVNGVLIGWSGRGTSHVDYNKTEELPLTQGRYLGYGVHGGVYETICNGVRLAWKRKHCHRKFGHRERREIEIIKKLSHRHVIRIVGTYTHGPFLGLLLWPVTTCDLANFLEDVDWLQRETNMPWFREPYGQSGTISESAEDWLEQRADRVARLGTLGIVNDSVDIMRSSSISYLERTLGCIASAVAYLHDSNIRHKDLKPSNILLSSDGLWITDFGTATDFSILSSSATDGGERGTPRYFAPEVAAFAPNGRAADIFSMGCIFFEFLTLCVGYSLALTRDLRLKNDKSFQANLDSIINWCRYESSNGRTLADVHLFGLIQSMFEPKPTDRPTAKHVEEDLLLIGGLARAVGAYGYSRGCCIGMISRP